MTITDNYETEEKCRYAESVACLPRIYGDNKIEVDCQACGLIHAALEIHYLADILAS